MKAEMSAQLKESIVVYGDGLRECLENHDIDPEDWDRVWGFEEDDIEADPEMQWLLAWFVGVGEALGVMPDKLIKLAPAVKAKVKATVAKAKAKAKLKKAA